jgi:pseudooxynicotine oxidase
VSDEAEQAGWYVGGARRAGSVGERDRIAARGWDRFVEGVEEVLPLPHDPLAAADRLARFDRLTIAERIDELRLSDEERDVLRAELESLAHGPLDEAGAVSVLRWHALSGYSLALTQFTGGRVTLDAGTGGLLRAIADGAPFETVLEADVAAVEQDGDGVVVTTRAGDAHAARVAVVAVPLNALPRIEFDPPLSGGKREGITLGQTSRGIKIFIRARGPAVHQNAIRPGHPFGYLATEHVHDGEQVLIGFGPDAARCDAGDLAGVQRALDDILPGYEALAATAHDWLADPFSCGTWAIHRPRWYGEYHAEMRRPEGRVVLAGSDIANGWAGFIDGAIETGFRAAGLALAALAGERPAELQTAGRKVTA